MCEFREAAFAHIERRFHGVTSTHIKQRFREAASLHIESRFRKAASGQYRAVIPQSGITASIARLRKCPSLLSPEKATRESRSRRSKGEKQVLPQNDYRMPQMRNPIRYARMSLREILARGCADVALRNRRSRVPRCRDAESRLDMREYRTAKFAQEKEKP